MTKLSTRDAGRSLTEEPIDLIRHILDKHHIAICEELQRLARERRQAKDLLREWLAAWASGRNETDLVRRTERHLCPGEGLVETSSESRSE